MVRPERWNFVRDLARDGVVLDVYSRVFEARYAQPADEYSEVIRAALGRDHLWILPAEIEALVRGEFPEPLARRIARFHRVDNTRGEPPMWERGELRQISITAAIPEREGEGPVAIDGSVQIQTADEQRGYSARLCESMEIRDGKLVRFDLVARGTYHGAGTYTSNSMPDGPFRFAVAFQLARPDDSFTAVPPQAARDLRDYLNP